jgi:hypothetical protein
MRIAQTVVKTLSLFFVLLGAVSLLAAAGLAGERAVGAKEKLPPIGERKYILDEKNPYAPVEIERKGKVVKETYLKDPIQPDSRIKPAPAVVHKPTPPKKPAKQVWLPTRLRFSKLAVRGHLMRPRVEFNRDILPVGRVDEPLRQDFFQKVFAPARDDNF